MAAALLLGHLRDDAPGAAGPGHRDRRRGDHRLQQPRPRRRRVHLHPGPVRDRLARGLRAARAGRAGRGGGGPRGAGRARARRREPHRRRRGARADRPRAARHRRPRRQRDGAPGGRRAAPAPRRARAGPRGAPGRRADGPDGARPRCATCSARCAATATGSSWRPSPASTGSSRCWTRSAARACRCDLHVEGEPSPLPPAIDLSAYRIVQEGLTNALKHARAGHADVTVRYAPDEVQIEVRDDGAGASPGDDPGLRARGHARAGQDLRRRDERGQRERRRLRPPHAPPARRRPAMTPRPRRRRPVDGPRRLPDAPLRRAGHRGGRRGRQRRRGRRARRPASTRPSC